MGMFDTIMADFNCPHCAYNIPKEGMEDTANDNDSAWQTKATDCSLNNYKIGDKLEFRNLRIQDGWMLIFTYAQNAKNLWKRKLKSKITD